MAYMRRIVSGASVKVRAVVRSVAMGEFFPAERHDDDLFFVEFPKSGLTWLSFLVANTNIQISGEQRAVTFFNIHDFVPDVHAGRFVSGPLSKLLGYRCIKSHSTYVPRYRKVIYLVRDPRDVLVSYYTHLRSIGEWRGTLEQFVMHGKYGVRAWVEHVAGWLDGVQPDVRFAIVRYEDLLADSACVLKRLYRLLGVPVSDENIAVAIEKSHIEGMRVSEIESSADHPALRDQEFVRRTRAGGARTPLPPDVQELIESEARDAMSRMGYEATPRGRIVSGERVSKC